VPGRREGRIPAISSHPQPSGAEAVLLVPALDWGGWAIFFEPDANQGLGKSVGRSIDIEMGNAWFLFKRRLFILGLKFFRVHDDQRRIAWGFTLGMVINFFPTFGFGLAFSGIFARLCGGNMVAGLAGGVGLVAFWPLLFYLNFKTGDWLCGSSFQALTVDHAAFFQWKTIMWGQSFMMGAVFNGLVVGLVVYFMIQFLFKRLRPVGVRYLSDRVGAINRFRIMQRRGQRSSVCKEAQPPHRS